MLELPAWAHVLVLTLMVAAFYGWGRMDGAESARRAARTLAVPLPRSRNRIGRRGWEVRP